MLQEEWRRVEELFHQTMEQPEDRREQFLKHRASGNPALEEEVRTLLRAHAARHVLLDAPDSTELPKGTRFGSYELIRVLGSGGMGTVYLGRRADRQFEKLVAIKLVNQSLTEIVAGGRFARERQILADLDHPGIARLVDAGISDLKLPYLVMEWVDGEPLDAWVRHQTPSIEQKFDTWLRVADAVSHAHQHRVVHRDLKPSNILVTREGAPKLVDFGIAKLLTSDGSTTTTAHTLHYTPRYASPEQVKGQAVTAQTDIYSLSVILHELVTGHHPFDTTDPPGRMPVLAQGISKDLALILATGLRNEPERRYATVDQLAEDVSRYRRGLKVSAQHETAVHRLRRFAERHRVAVSAAAAALLASVVLAALSVRDQLGAARANVRVIVSPNPVPFSGAAITNRPACAGATNTWFYDQTLTESAGVAVDITAGADTIDGVQRPEVASNLRIPPKGSTTTHHAFCFGQPGQHTIQKTYRGTDANGHEVTFSGPVATLLAPK